MDFVAAPSACDYLADVTCEARLLLVQVRTSVTLSLSLSLSMFTQLD